jgi:hypothetical protein
MEVKIVETEEFERLCHSKDDYTWVEQENNDVTGGTITFKEIDNISEFEHFDKVMISGLKQDSFEYFVQTQGHKFQAIMFWKNKLVEDWSILSTLKDVKFIGYFHNQRVTQIWDMTNNDKLEGLYISDFTSLHSLDGLQKAPRLERIHFGDAVWPTSVLNNLKGLENSHLKEFNYSGKVIKEDDISIYTKMPNLEILNFPTNLYTTEQLAWLTAKLPKVQGYALRPYIKFDDNTDKDVLICGKRKPFLSSKKDELRIQKYEENFQQLVKQFTDES